MPGRELDLQNIRQRLGLSVEEMARALGVRPALVERWEQQGGFRPTPAIVVKLEALMRAHGSAKGSNQSRADKTRGMPFL